MPFVDTYVENKWASVNLTRFEPEGENALGSIGITPNDGVVSGGHDVFPEQAFIDAIWELYPDGLPPKSLSKKEEHIREMATYLLNRRYLVTRTYAQAVQDLDPATVKAAREDAEVLIAMARDGDE